EAPAVPVARVPRAVFRTLEAGDAGRDRGRLDRQRVHAGDVAEVVEAEPSRADEAARRGAEAELVALLGHGLVSDRHRQTVEAAIGEAARSTGLPRFVFVPTYT